MVMTFGRGSIVSSSSFPFRQPSLASTHDCIRLLYELSTPSLCIDCLNGGDRVRTPKWLEDLIRRSIKEQKPILRSARLAGGKTMWDIGCVVASTLFFCIAIGYAMGCDRLGMKEAQK